MRKAFLDAVADITSNIVLRVVVERLERGDVNGAVNAMNLEPEAFVRLETAIREAYNAGGISFVEGLPALRDPDGARVRFFFSPRNIRAERYLERHSAALVTGITDEIRASLRQTFTQGLMEGANPTRTALNAIGRVNKVTGRREGGVIGLTAQQERFVSNARAELSNVETMRAYLERGRRDMSFDKTVLKAIKDGKPLPAETIDRIVGKYADSLLKLRGDTIAMNETMTAMAKAREDALLQQVESGKIDAAAVQKVWKHTPQERPRLHHKAMNGKSVRLGEKFVLSNGVQLDGPHSDDAPASERIHCKCFVTYKINYLAAVERRYKARAA